MKNHNYSMRVYLNNVEKKKDFATTFNYADVNSLASAIEIVRVMHTEIKDSKADIARKIKKVVFNNKNISVFEHGIESTNNGWLVK